MQEFVIIDIPQRNICIDNEQSMFVRTIRVLSDNEPSKKGSTFKHRNFSQHLQNAVASQTGNHRNV